jgi:hypothetical protein
MEEEIRSQGGEATYVHLDVTREADWVEAVGTAVNRYGTLDILVNNAGIVLRKGIEDTSEADWDRIMAMNAKGVFLGTKHAIPARRRAGGGSINKWCLSLTNKAIMLVFYKLNSAIERGTKPDALGCRPCHWTSTLKAAMVNARRASK